MISFHPIDPDTEIAEKLVALGDSSRDLGELADLLPMPGVDPAEFRQALRVDLQHAVVWLLRHCARARQPLTLSARMSSRRRALVFLPRYAVAAHLIRRALPFAALGFSTEIVLGRTHQVEPHKLRRFLEILGVADRIRTVSGSRDLRHAFDEVSYVAATGRIGTLRSLDRYVGSASMLGAAGRCAVVIGRSEDELDRLRESFAGCPWPSCSQARVYLNGSGAAGGRYRALRSEDLAPLLARLHPSAVFTTSETWEEAVNATGYHASPVDNDGKVTSLEGFARDPVFGWPGDWML